MKYVLFVFILLTACSESIDTINAKIKVAQENGKNEEAYSLYEKIVTDFPETEHHAQALFQMAFMNNNNFKNFDLAKQQYEEFLKRFPNHELVSSAKFELKYIGVPVNEIPFIKDSLQTKDEIIVQ